MSKLYLDSDAKWSFEGRVDLSSVAVLPLTEDSSSSKGRLLRVPLTQRNTELVRCSFEGLDFGMYSFVVFAKTSTTNGSNEFFKIAAYAQGQLITSYNVKESDFTTAGRWEALGIGIDFQGNTGDVLDVVLSRGDYNGSADLYIDNVYLQPAPVAINALQ